MKIITVVIPTYNEESNVLNTYERVKSIFNEKLTQYDFQILYIDNASKDNTRSVIKELCVSDNRVQAIFNNTNFGFSRSTFYGLSQAEGDAAILMYADMQDPPEIIPEFISKWEEGYKVVVGIKSKSKENICMYALRDLYYKILDRFSEIEHIKQFDGFGLYDASFIKELRRIKDSLPYLRGIVSELGPERGVVEYTQDIRKNGKSSFNLLKYYDVAMLGITSSSKAVLRLAVLGGLLMSFICIIIALLTFILKIMNWNYYDVGTAAIITGIFFVGGIQLLFLGIIGEYIANINSRTMHHPIVIESERINMHRKVLEDE
ncbi:MAG: glycosyltransferase family 2 protein [Eubacterium sp.]|nr:glycosyltransferase family 2 protein [Eubacterium sp.]